MQVTESKLYTLDVSDWDGYSLLAANRVTTIVVQSVTRCSAGCAFYENLYSAIFVTVHSI